jgi:class 3 adenylate cyclase/KaiC/GvpD/RAD55 family RecA-like ATPase
LFSSSILKKNFNSTTLLSSFVLRKESKKASQWILPQEEERGEKQRRLAAIVFTDMVGYTALSQINEPLALQLLNEHREILRCIFSKFHGKEIKTIGDGFLVEFASALDAVECAYQIQQTLGELNLDRPLNRRILLRIGIHLGDVIHDERGDLHGDAVNIASRIESVATPGSICISEQVFAQVRNKFSGGIISKLPPQKLKNVGIPLDIYRVLMPWDEQVSVAYAFGGGKEIDSGPFSTKIKRISSGIETLDQEIGGGLPESTTTMVYGAPKTGKSVFALQFLVESIRKQEPCLFVMTDYSPSDLARAISGFDWSLRRAITDGCVCFLDMTSTSFENHDKQDLETVELASGSLAALQYASVANVSDLASKCTKVLELLGQRGRQRTRVVLDSITSLFIYNPPLVVAKCLRQFSMEMKAKGSVGILVTYVEGSIDSQSELILKSSVDNLIRLREGGELIVEGMLGTPKMNMAYRITSQGLKVGA